MRASRAHVARLPAKQLMLHNSVYSECNERVAAGVQTSPNSFRRRCAPPRRAGPLSLPSATVAPSALMLPSPLPPQLPPAPPPRPLPAPPPPPRSRISRKLERSGTFLFEFLFRILRRCRFSGDTSSLHSQTTSSLERSGTFISF